MHTFELIIKKWSSDTIKLIYFNVIASSRTLSVLTIQADVHFLILINKKT